ncbi:MAG: class I SAM-dependent methyltransferase [Chloroflexi bacterium]|nr:class I SAM-dependent methyltransferase [Chloroflexota bacterium]
MNSLSRWQQFYLDDSKLGSIPPSSCAQQAAKIFSEKNSQIILDLGCGTGRDSLCLASGGATVIGLDAARSGLLLAQKRAALSHSKPSWVESDSRGLPFPDALFDGVYCFGLLHEFVGESAESDVRMTMDEINRVLKPSGVAIVATVVGDPEKGVPHVQNFSEAMFDDATAGFRCIEKKVYDDLGCTGRPDYKVWFGHLEKT